MIDIMSVDVLKLLEFESKEKIMSLNDDRIDLAYKGKLGVEFAEKTRKRINWVVNQVKGKRILDIGTSQGTIPIILGREGKCVEGIDINEDAIMYAEKQLMQEHASVQQNITFRVANFMTDIELKDEYDNVLLTEVLEHISDVDSFLEKVTQVLSKKGTLVITIPFGINNYLDHKETYYLKKVKEKLQKHFIINHIEFLGEWTGIVCVKNNHVPEVVENVSATPNELARLEEAFYSKENHYLEIIKKLSSKLKTTDEISSGNNSLSTSQMTTLFALEMVGDTLKYYSKEDFSSHKLMDLFKNKTLNSTDLSDLAVNKKIISTLNEVMVDYKKVLDREEQLIKEFEKVSLDNHQLRSELLKNNKSYKALRQSKLGKVQVKYWEIKNRFK